MTVMAEQRAPQLVSQLRELVEASDLLADQLALSERRRLLSATATAWSMAVVAAATVVAVGMSTIIPGLQALVGGLTRQIAG
jgi:hypothetical protein